VSEKKARRVKLRKDVSIDAEASNLESCVSLSLIADEVSEATSESSITISLVVGPDRSRGRKSARRRPLSADLGPTACHNHARAAVASYNVCSCSARGSPYPPPWQHSVRRSPSPTMTHQSLEQRRAASPAGP
jgi:hypothetical protein